MYGSFAGFVTYHTARGTDVSEYDETEVNAALLVSTVSFDARYRGAFAGEKTEQRDQPYEWPRTGSYDENGDSFDADEIPVEVEYSTYELALQQLINPGSLSANYTPSKYSQVSVDGAVSVVYNERSSAAEARTMFGIVDEIVSPILVIGGSGYSGDVIR